MINTAYWNFQVMHETFTIGDVAVYVPGVMDPPTSPMFSGTYYCNIVLLSSFSCAF